MGLTASQEAAETAEGFEGFRSAPYQDPAGVWTVGFGSTRDAHGRPITASTPTVTREEAEELLERDMRSAFATVQGDVSVPLTPEQEAALADFIYNVGAGNFAHSTLLRDLNAGDYTAAADQFLVWDHAGGRVLAGLLRRREAEKALFTQEPNPAPEAAHAAPVASPEGSWLTTILQTIARFLQSQAPTPRQS